MKTLFAAFARGGGSLAALAAALALTAPASAQEMPTFQPDEPTPAAMPAPASPPERPMRIEASGGPGRAEIVRAERGPDQRPDRPAGRFERIADPQITPPPPSSFGPQAPFMRIDPDTETATALAQRDQRGGRRGRGGFGSQVVGQAQNALPEQRADRIDRRSERRAERVDDRSEQRARQVDQRSERRAERVEERGDQRARQLDWRGRDAAADRVDRRSEWRADRIEDRGDRRADRIEDRGDRRARVIENRGDRRADRVDNWRDGRREDWRDGRRDGWRDGRRDDWRDGRRDDWRDNRRDWRRDDWRWGWNGRPGWDNRNFRHWNNGWRGNRSYNWFDYRRTNQSLFRPGRYYAPYQSHRYSRLSIGLFLDSLFFQPRFFINDPYAYRLPPAYGPYQWVRYYDDVVLVDIYTGEVVDAIYDFFW